MHQGTQIKSGKLIVLKLPNATNADSANTHTHAHPVSWNPNTCTPPIIQATRVARNTTRTKIGNGTDSRPATKLPVNSTIFCGICGICIWISQSLLATKFYGVTADGILPRSGRNTAGPMYPKSGKESYSI